MKLLFALVTLLALCLAGCSSVNKYPLPTDPAVEYSDSELGCWLSAIEWAEGDGEVYRIISGSMVPTLLVGDYVVIREKPWTEFVPYHIAQVQPAWMPPGSMTWLHRIVMRRGSSIITAGDANPRSDPDTVEADAKGILVGIWRVKK